MSIQIQELKKMVIRINSSLPYYEKNYVSVKRTPLGDKERVQSFRQYIECRLNFECFNVLELRSFAEEFDGHLFEVTAIIDQDDLRRRFSYVCAEICKTGDFYIGEKNFMDTLSKLEELLGGSKLRFNYSQKKTKIFIE